MTEQTGKSYRRQLELEFIVEKDKAMSDEELRLAKNIGEQMSGKILCPRECVTGQALSVFGDDEDSLFCPHCEMEVQLTVKYVN